MSFGTLTPQEDMPLPPRSIGSGAISFGLVSIPVKLYLAPSSQAPSFNLLHAECGNRIRQQRFCPACNKVIEREDLIKGYEIVKDQYVRVTDDELKALEGEASEAIEISEFVPLARTSMTTVAPCGMFSCVPLPRRTKP